MEMRSGDRVGLGVVAIRGFGRGQVDWDEAAGMGGDELVQWPAGEAGGFAGESGPGAVVDGAGMSVLPRDGPGEIKNANRAIRPSSASSTMITASASTGRI
jgi:hypothetical protein